MNTTFGKLTVPMAIVIAGVLLAGAFFFSRRAREPVLVPTTASGDAISDIVLPVTENDHVLGDPDAPIVIIEYSDTECPFCKQFHTTLHRIMDTYGRDGSVAWVYRHFPLDDLHPRARKEAEAAECAEDQGGNAAFWEYIDRIYEITPSNNGLDPAILPLIAFDLGLDRVRFEACLTEGTFVAKVEKHVNDAIKAGAAGTPHSFIVARGNILPLEGAEPYASLRGIIEALQEE